MREFLKVMKALSDPNRVMILKMVEKRVMCVCEIHTILGIAQSTASKHLKILEDAGLVRSYKDGLWVNFTLPDISQSDVNPYIVNILSNLKGWLNDDVDVINLVEKLPKVQREIICGAKKG
ncbi:MAG: winged helix-turn-helix transcriptional regulator [Desulfamplus sp.]|nr:winged helix-turn-helix transcriptional regulator [Desulfamplus sp.]